MQSKSEGQGPVGLACYRLSATSVLSQPLTLAPFDADTERGCVRRTSRSRTEDEGVLKQSNAPLPAMTLRLGLRPQPRSDRCSAERDNS
jgi:hypothetical protein